MMNYSELFEKQKQYYFDGKAQSYSSRIAALKKLKAVIIKHEGDLAHALKIDLGKSHFEAYGSEIGACLKEISYTLKNLKSWMQPTKVSPSILNFPSTGKIIYEAYGNVLVVAPWNYPVMLCLGPVIGAIAAGNTVMIKTSEMAVETSIILEKIINENFEEGFLRVVTGAVPETTEILKLPFDYLFFTGSPQVGKIMMAAAAKNLTPVTLELGGKSPCVIDRDVNLDLATKRIVWGKFFNQGQTCIAPDYVYVHESQYDQFVALFRKYVLEFYTDNPEVCEDYGHIINEGHFDRLLALIDKDKLVAGGEYNRATRYIAPTLLGDVSWDDDIMASEIFGPILPILKYSDLDSAVNTIRKHPKPLAFYLFSNNSKNKIDIMHKCSFGGGCINDTLVHFTEDSLPFGGVGNSGMGSYHGKKSFFTFSHEKSLLIRENWYDNPVRYAPYKGKLKFLKLLFR